jgi:type I restriction enzyme R subunit
MTRFVLIDAVGVTEHDFVDPPLNRVKGVSLKKLLDKAATLSLTEDETATLASRLTKLELQLTPAERDELDAVADIPMRDIVRNLVEAVDPDTHARLAAEAADPAAAIQDLLTEAIRPIAANPALRQRIIELRATHDRVIDEVSTDQLLDAHGVVDTTRARSIVESWKKYLQEHRDEITAIQLLTEARERHISFDQIQELAERIRRPHITGPPT